jgi:hypothetical protein
VKTIRDQQPEDEKRRNSDDPLLRRAPCVLKGISTVEDDITEEIPHAHMVAIAQKPLELGVYLPHSHRSRSRFIRR